MSGGLRAQSCHRLEWQPCYSKFVATQEYIHFSINQMYQMSDIQLVTSSMDVILSNQSRFRHQELNDEWWGERRLHVACKDGDVALVQSLLIGLAEFGHTRMIDIPSVHKLTPLHCAATKGHLEIVKELITHGAFVGSQNAYGETPLHLASLKGHKEVAAYLLDNGADINARNRPDGQTPLHYSIYNDNVDIASLLQVP